MLNDLERRWKARESERERRVGLLDLGGPGSKGLPPPITIGIRHSLQSVRQ